MKLKRSNKTLSLFLCMVLIVAMALFTTGCNGDTGEESQTDKETSVTQETDDNLEEDTSSEAFVLGEGEKQFLFTVVDGEGKETQFEIHTEKETVGEALLDLGLIDGEDGDYGLYVKTVNGITADYDTDGVYWAFYINGEYASTSVDLTTIAEGDSYTFKVEK